MLFYFAKCNHLKVVECCEMNEVLRVVTVYLVGKMNWGRVRVQPP